MHDIKALRDDAEPFRRGWAARGVEDVEELITGLLERDQELRGVQTRLQEAQARRNEASKLIGQAKARRDETSAQALMAEVEALKGELAALADRERALKEALLGPNGELAKLPQLPGEDVPPGADESGNVEVRRWGERRAIAAPKDHVELGEALGGMDFEAAARMSGSRFVVLKGQLARLERALGQFMLDLHTREHGYEEVQPPLLVRDDAVFGTTQLPKFQDDLFSARQVRAVPSIEAVQDIAAEFGERIALREIGRRPEIVGQGMTPELEAAISPQIEAFSKMMSKAFKDGRFFETYWLIPTAEVSLTNLVREQIVEEDALPLRYTALTPCFRSEAGASGKDTRGMIRQHQFNKVELVSITAPEHSGEEHERMTACAEAVLERLGLPYRRMLLCAGDMGFAARKTYDLEVWLPSQGAYREISSCSEIGDFQARRMDARYRRSPPSRGGEKGARFVHTLNGSGVAVGRALVAVMENYQDEGGRIAVPEALAPYMGGIKVIGGEA